MQLERKRSDNAKIAAAAAERPEQIRIFVGIAFTNFPFANTTSAESKLSMLNPHFRVR